MFSERFAAKRRAIAAKRNANGAKRNANGAKREAKWCKTQGEMVQNAMRMHYFSCCIRVLCIASFEE